MHDVTQLRIERVEITLRLTADVQLPVYHGRSLHGLVSRALDVKPFPRTIAVRCAEWWSFRRRAGSLYRFGITGLGAGCALLEDARTKIGRRGTSPHRGGQGTLDGCFEIASFEHSVCGSLAEEIEALRGARGDLDLRFRTPLYLKRPKSSSTDGLGYINREEFPLDVLLAAVARRVDEVVAAPTGTGASDAESMMLPPPSDAVTIDVNAAINLNYREPATGGRAAARPVEGMQGLVRVKDLHEAWLPYLAFATYAHVGTGIGYGQGQLVIERDGVHVGEWCPPAGTLFEQMLEPAVLAAAEQHVFDGSDVHHDGWLPAHEGSVEGVERAVVALRDHTYEPPFLIGTLIPKRTGGMRALAYPPSVDRVLQRAAHDVLDADLDVLFEESSYAYRKGRSVRQAAAAIQRFHARGFEWVLDADITSFFDNVDWDVLAERIQSVLGTDPLGAALLAWMKAPVLFAKVRYDRIRGLPQGSPLSPLLANLYLDSLDEHLSANGFAVVRYADDFVVLCRDAEAAATAKHDAEAELATLHLSLSPDKTRSMRFDDGFHFLGIQFGQASELVAAGPATDAARVDANGASSARDIPPGSWLEGVPLVQLQRVLERSLRSGPRPQVRRVRSDVLTQGEKRPTATNDPVAERQVTFGSVAVDLPAGSKRPLFVTDREAEVMLRGEKVTITRPHKQSMSLPLRSISHITVIGGTRFTVSLALRCADVGVPVFFCRDGGELRACIAPLPDWNVLRRQLSNADDPALCLRIAKSIVRAKIQNSATLMVRFHFADASARANELRTLRESCEAAGTVDEVLGYEGRAARSYFEGWQASLDPQWGFAGRSKHPPRDPVNAMLSLSYTILHQHISTALISAGLDPRVGLMHRARATHHALASDVQEEFRHLAESVVWSIVAHRQVTIEAFTNTGEQGVRMHDGPRRVFVGLIEERLKEQFTPPGRSERQSYREFIDVQARVMRDVCCEPGAVYSPLELRA